MSPARSMTVEQAVSEAVDKIEVPLSRLMEPIGDDDPGSRTKNMANAAIHLSEVCIETGRRLEPQIHVIRLYSVIPNLKALEIMTKNSGYMVDETTLGRARWGKKQTMNEKSLESVKKLHARICDCPRSEAYAIALELGVTTKQLAKSLGITEKELESMLGRH